MKVVWFEKLFSIIICLHIPPLAITVISNGFIILNLVLSRLFFAGKQLENGCNLLDYKVNVNDVIILMDCGAVNVRKDENKNPEKATVSKPETLVKSKAKKNIGEVAKPQEVTSKFCALQGQ